MVKRKLIVIFAALLISQNASASTAVGRVGEIWVSPTSYLIMFSVPDSDSKLHRCNTSERFSVNLSLPGGSATFKLLQYAKQNKYIVTVETLNTCNAFDAENVKNISVK